MHRNENDDGIYEPEEKVFVSSIAVENVGGMPTPAHHDVRIAIRDDGWIAPADMVLRLPRSLGPGETHVFAEGLELTLRMFRPQTSGAPLAAPETIHLHADLPSARRSFGDFEKELAPDTGKLTVRFPVEVSPLRSLFSLGPGEAARMQWSITNVSDRPFGEESVVGRAVAVHLVRAGGELGVDDIHLFDPTGARVSLEEGFRCAIPRLEPKQSASFETTIAVAESAPPYASARLVVAGELGHIAAPTRVRPVQYQEITLRVGRPFEARDADILFVVNNRTTGPELAAWEELAQKTGLTSQVWDAALEGGVSVLSDVASGARRYRLVVMLNNMMDTPAGERRASTLLDKSTSLALARLGTHVLYVGRAPEIADLAIPSHAATRETRILAADAKQDEILAAFEGEEIGGAGATIDITTWYAWPWAEIREEHLAARARALAEVVAKRWPHRRYVIVPRFTPSEEKRVGWVRVVRLGSLEVRRATDSSRSALSGFEANANDMHDAAFPREATTFGAMLHALPFETKVSLLEGCALPFDAASTAGTALDPVVSAVLADLVHEQTTAAEASGWRASSDALRAMLPMLDHLEGHAFAAPVDLATDRGSRFVELLAWLELVARGHARWWEWAPPVLWLSRGRALRSFVRDTIERVLRRVESPGATEKPLRSAVEARTSELTEAWKAWKTTEIAALHTREYAAARIAAPHASRPIETDAAVLPRAERVVDHARIDSLREKELGRVERSREVVAGAAEARRSLLHPSNCAELLAASRARMRVADDAAQIASRVEDEVEEASLGDLAALRER